MVKKGHVLEELWLKKIETYLEMESKSKVMDSMALCLTDMDGYSIYDILALELSNLLDGLDTLGLEQNTGEMYARSHRYNKIKYAVMDASEQSLINIINVDNSNIRNVQIIDEGPYGIHFIFNLSYADILHGLPS
jgi:hypothetical protein